MCGNGKSCDECGRGPCGPTPSRPKIDKDTCRYCHKGQQFVRATNHGGIYKRCPECGGTGRSESGRYKDRIANGELEKKVNKYNADLEAKVKKAQANIRKWKKELTKVSVSTMKLCDDCKGLGYTTSKIGRGHPPVWRTNYHDCEVCNKKGMVPI